MADTKERRPAMRSKGNGKRKPAGDSKGERTSTVRLKRMPQNHRTIDRVTHIREQVVYNPGMTFAELVRALDAAKSSVHGFISGLLATGWLYQEQHRFYLGPAVYGLTLASGHIRAGLVTREDLVALQQETGVAAFQISRGCEETTVRLPRARRSVARDVRDRPADQLAAEGAATPVLFVTAHDDPQAHTNAMAGPCAGYFRKTDAGSEILDAIRRAVEPSGAAP